jgi:hypothetical protein
LIIARCGRARKSGVAPLVAGVSKPNIPPMIRAGIGEAEVAE